MSRGVVIKLNSKGVKSLLRSSDVAGDLTRRAGNIRSAAGEGYEVESETGRNRSRAVVVTSTFDAMRREAQLKTLLTALNAGRL